jgi:hypothetical protein
LNETQEKLEEMTEKFIQNLEDRISTADIDDDNLRENTEAYLEDARHFLAKEDYIRAFESAVYCSGLLDTETRLGD